MPEIRGDQAGEEFFTANGFDVYNYDRYSDQETGGRRPRSLGDGITIARQASDIQDICRFFQGRYRKIYLAGHSYGGLTLVYANAPVAAVALWDATYAANRWLDCDWCRVTFSETDQGEKRIFLSWLDGQEHLINPSIYYESKCLTREVVQEWAKCLTAPALIVNIRENAEAHSGYQHNIPANRCLVVNADHDFTEPATRDWFNRY